MRSFAGEEGVVAIGETGLDYHYERWQQHRIRQKIWFRWLIRLADEKKLPLILHIRNADEDAIKILRRYRGRLHGGVCHCFCSGPEAAKIYTQELGLCLGIGGALLEGRERTRRLQEAVAATPLSFLLLETDGPYVKPARPAQVSRKKWEKARNTSLILPAVAEEIARIKGVDVSLVERVTEENTRRLFGIGEPVRGDERPAPFGG